jgi:hypothetical protein
MKLYTQRFFPGNIVSWSNIVHKNKMMRIVESWEREGEPRYVLLTEVEGSDKCYPVAVDEVTFVEVGKSYEFNRPAKRPDPVEAKEFSWVAERGNDEGI